MRDGAAEFAIVHNIPSPYRLHLFSVLADQLAKRGLALHVHFMAASHGDRLHWGPAATAMPYASTRWRDVGPRIAGKEWHLNPGLIAHLRAAPPRWLMVGGPWDTLTGAAVSLLARAPNSIAWFEGNTSTPGRLGPIARTIKRHLLERYRFWAVPGVEGVKYASKLSGADAGPRCAILPNIVEETRFSPRGEDLTGVRAMLSVPQGARLAIWPARLIPAKGVVPFLQALKRQTLAGWALRILGDGPLKPEIWRTIKERGLEDLVSVVPSVSYEAMPMIYAAAELFVLPSLHDPNPLSVVEAMHSGLPIAISRRLGNFPEALAEGENGWSMDPTNPSSIQEAMGLALGASAERLRSMGQASRERATAQWSSVPAIERFLASLGIGG